MEIFKDIPGYNNYQVSNEGKILNKVTNKILKNRKIFGGYIQVALYENKIRKVFMVHRLVYCVFNNIDLLFTGHNTKNLICHINDIRNDNRLENLFIGTNKENIDDCISKGRYIRIYKSKSVMQFLKGEKIAEFKSIRQAALITGVERTMIGGCCKGIRNTGGGFNWKYS